MSKFKTTFFKRIILVFLSALMIFGNALIVNGSVPPEHKITPYYVVMDSSTLSLDIQGIKATCSASLVADRKTSLKIKMELQKKKSSGYTTVETWTTSDTNYSLGIIKSRNINVFCDYRLKVTFTAGSETKTAYKYA